MYQPYSKFGIDDDNCQSDCLHKFEIRYVDVRSLLKQPRHRKDQKPDQSADDGAVDSDILQVAADCELDRLVTQLSSLHSSLP